MEPQPNLENQNLNQNKNPYKILFFVSLGLFLVIISVLVTLLITQKSSKSTQTIPTDTEETNLTPTETVEPVTESITSTQTETTITPTKSATTSSVPKDWKTYTDSTYKYSINYSPEWAIKTYPEYKNIIVFQSSEGKKLEELNKSSPPGDAPFACGDYQITCYKAFTEMVDKAEREEKKISSLSSWLKTSLFKNFSQNTINGFTSYSVTQLGLSETKEFYIQNKDLSFCQITFCGDRDLTSVEKQFLNSFKFN